MKSYTDISQSRKLAEILPLVSADMYYLCGDEGDPQFGTGFYEELEDGFSDGRSRPADIPCWSLAALLEVLDRGALFKTPQGWVCQAYVESKAIISNYHSSSIDACYEMIIKLHEQELL